MSGPRITSGEDSLQDAATPPDFMAAVAARFGKPVFDLAAHRLNKKHARYFAPPAFSLKFDPRSKAPIDPGTTIAGLVMRGALESEARPAVLKAVADGAKTTIVVQNHDPDATALDAFKQDWAEISIAHGGGLLWLNCEFSEIAPWATRCAFEARRGANITLLTPAVVANWYRDIVAGVADVYECSGRICFDGKSVFPKDCMVSNFWPGATGLKAIWDWRRNQIAHRWELVAA